MDFLKKIRKSDLQSSQFIFENDSISLKTVNLFDGTGLFDAEQSRLFSNASQYNFLIQNIKTEPIRVFFIDIITTTFNQLTKVLLETHVNSNGEIYQVPIYPTNDFSAYQQQSLKVSVPFEKLVLDSRTYFENYNILPFERVTFILWYIQSTRNIFNDSSMSLLIKNPLNKALIFTE